MEIKVRNVNEAVSRGLHFLIQKGIKETSRNGDVLVAPGAVTTTYTKPNERVLFAPLRDANPFFHLMESLWMLAGRNDVDFPVYFNKRFREYSDDGKITHGAYGYRWIKSFKHNQLEVIANELKKNPNSRRCVLAMWDASFDNHNDLWLAMNGGKDVPCNTHAYFEIRHGKLNMTVCCRSNDIIWGAYGANAVHFSVLQEYMAAWIGVEIGVYRQFSNNYHAYTDTYDTYKLQEISLEAHRTDFYTRNVVKPYPLVSTSTHVWDEDLRRFMEDPLSAQLYNDDFFNEVARPMYRAYYDRKEGFGTGMGWIEQMDAPDWRLACQEWIMRREERKRATAA